MSRTSRPTKREGTKSAADRRPWFWRVLEGPVDKTAYWLILTTTVILTGIGVTMVLSASSVENIGGSGSYATLTSQGLFAVIGLALMFWLSHWKPQTFRRIAWAAYLLAVVLLVLVQTPLGVNVNGNQNWIRIGGMSIQPSEFAKLALAVWGGHIVALKQSRIHKLSELLIPLLPGGLVLIVLVLAGRDLGTVLVLLLILAAILFIAGLKMRYLIGAGLLGSIAVLIAAFSSDNRRVRIDAWLGQCDHPSDPCYQYDHGIFALASGGWWGVGLGQSRQKWSYIPESENDFIFTILGEELGLMGALAVLLLFVLLAVGMFRVAYRADHPFIRVCTTAVLVWLVGQAFLNIAMVTGILPVIGVPLPFISAGGSALLSGLMAVGTVLSFTRVQQRQIAQNEDTEGTEQPDDGAADAPESAGSTTAPLPVTRPAQPIPSPLRRPPRTGTTGKKTQDRNRVGVPK